MGHLIQFPTTRPLEHQEHRKCKTLQGKSFWSWSQFLLWGAGNDNNKHLKTFWKHDVLRSQKRMLSHAWVEWIGLVKTFCPTFWRRPSAKKNILAAWVGVANYVAFARVKLLLPAAVSSFHMETCVKTSSIAWEHDVLSWNNTCLYSGRHGCDHQHYALSSHGVRKKKNRGQNFLLHYAVVWGLCWYNAGQIVEIDSYVLSLSWLKHLKK